MKALHLLSLCFTAAIVFAGCSTPAAFKASSITDSEKVGIFTVRVNPHIFHGGGLAGQLSNLIVSDDKELYQTLYYLNLTDKAEHSFIDKTRSILPCSLRKMENEDAVLNSKGYFDEQKTAQKMGLSKYFYFSFWPTLSEKMTNGVSTSTFDPELRVEGKLVNTSNGKVLWKKKVARTGTPVSRYNRSDLQQIFSGMLTEVMAEITMSLKN